MKAEFEAFTHLWSIHDHIINRYPLVEKYAGNYNQVVKITLYNYPFTLTDKQKRDLKRSVSIRNNICHFKSISQAEHRLLKQLAQSFKASPLCIHASS